MDIVAVVLAITAVLLSAVYIAKFWARRVKLHSVINKIPGPPTYPIIGTTYIYLRSTRRGLLDALERIIKNYGPISRTRLGPKQEVILLKPEHYEEKVYAELSEIFQGSQRSPTMNDLHEMKYLEKVIKESLRLYPTVPFIERVLKEDMNIDGYDIPAGTTVSLLIYFANRNPEYFPNPDEFNPDNFLPERVLSRHNFAFVPFSAGPRNCIGQKFAMLEEKTILSSILRRFKIRSLERREDVNPIPEVVLRPQHGIKVALTSRT